MDPPKTNPIFPLDSKILKIRIILFLHLLGILVPPRILLGVHIEAARVARISYRRDDGPTIALLVDGVPIHPGKEGMRLHSRRAALHVAQSSGSVDGAQLSDDVLGGVTEGWGGGEDNGFFDDSVRAYAGLVRAQGLAGKKGGE